MPTDLAAAADRVRAIATGEGVFAIPPELDEGEAILKAASHALEAGPVVVFKLTENQKSVLVWHFEGRVPRDGLMLFGVPIHVG